MEQPINGIGVKDTLLVNINYQKRPSIISAKSIFSSQHNVHDPDKFKEPLLSTIDILISIFVVTPLVVACWRGSWKYMDANSQYFPPYESFVLGVTIHILLAIVQDYLHDVLIRQKEKQCGMKILIYVSMKLYTYIFLIVTNLHWRGVWSLLDKYPGIQYAADGRRAIIDGSFYVLLIAAAAFCILCLMRCLRNASAPPFAICLDQGDSMFLFPTMFKVKVREHKFLRILDCSFSVLIVGNLVVIFWRGLWILLDILLAPNDEIIWSSWISLILGYLLVAIIFRIQTPMEDLCANQKGIFKVFIADFYILLSIVGTLNVWRGIWNLLDTYLQIGKPEVSFLVSHYLCFLCLVLMNCSNSCLVRGVFKDAAEPGGKSVVFPCQFLRVILQEEKLTTYKRVPRSEDFIEEISNGKILSNVEVKK